MASARRILALAVAGRSVTVLEAAAANGGAKALRTAEFRLPEEILLSETARAGKALKQFLRAGRFSTRRCVIGIEARHLTAREKSLPPGSAGSTAQILSLALEREFASDRDDLVFDYLPPEEGAQKPSVLLAAAPRQYVQEVSGMAQAAGLTVGSVMASAAALAGLDDNTADGDQLGLHLSDGAAELTIRSRGALRMLRRLSVTVPKAPAEGQAPPDTWLGDLAGELRRVVSLLPGWGGPDRSPGQLVVWDEDGQSADFRSHLTGALGLAVHVPDSLDGMDFTAIEPQARQGQVLAAGALALAGLRAQPPQLDFLHSRLAPAKKVTLGRKVVWGSVAAVVVLALVAVFVWDWQVQKAEIADLKARLGTLAKPIAEAQDVIKKDALARTWYDRRPGFLDCLRELTLAFPPEGGIWATSLAIQEDLRVVVSGKAVNESLVLDVPERLKANPALAEVKLNDLRWTGGERREVAFKISCRFVGAK